MKKVPAFLTLTIIALVAAILLAATDGITREPIRQAAVNASNVARAAVLPQAESFAEQEADAGIGSIYTGSKDGQLVGYVATVTVQGFGGPIEVTLGMDMSHQLTGLSVGGSAFAETAGLGALAKEPAFTDQFMGKAAPVTLGADVDTISGATITSQAVVRAVNLAAEAIQTLSK